MISSFLRVIKVLSEALWGPMGYLAVCGFLVWRQQHKTLKVEQLLLIGAILFAFVWRMFVHFISQRYFVCFEIACIGGIVLGLEEIWKKNKKFAWNIVAVIALILLARAVVLLFHIPFNQQTGFRIKLDATNYSSAALVMQDNNSMRLSYYSGVKICYPVEKNKDLKKYLWQAHYLADVVYFEGTGEKTFSPAFFCNLPGLQTPLEAKLFFHTPKNRRGKEIFIYKQEIKPDIFTKECSRELMLNGDFKNWQAPYSLANPNFAFTLPKNWGILNYTKIDQTQKTVVGPAQGGNGLEITVPKQKIKENLWLISPPLTVRDNQWIEFQGAFSPDAKVTVNWGFFSKKQEGLGEEIALLLEGKKYSETQTLRIPANSALWNIKSNNRRLIFHIKQGKVRLVNFYIVSY